MDVTYTADGTVDDVTYTSPDSSLYYLTPYANNPTAGEGLLNSMNSNIMDVFVEKNAYWQPYLEKIRRYM